MTKTRLFCVLFAISGIILYASWCIAYVRGYRNGADYCTQRIRQMVEKNIDEFMSKNSFDPNCPGCKPVMIDIATGKVLPPDDPLVVHITKVYEELPLADKKAFHDFTCLNSRDPEVMQRMARIQKLMSQ